MILNLLFISFLNYFVESGQCDGSSRCSFSSEEVTISGTTFTSLSSGASNGGAIYIDNCEVSISQSSFASCTTNKQGGAIYCQQSSSHTFSLRDCNFNKCSAFDGGALFYKQTASSSDEISNCIFQECKASGIGGGAFFQSNGGSIVDCTFLSCQAEFNGGCLVYWNVAINSDSGIVQRCIFNAVLSLYNPNELYTTTRESRNIQPLKIADCCFFAQSNWQNNPGCFLIAAGSGIEFEGSNYLGGDEDSIVWPFSGKIETSSITYNSQECPKEMPTNLPNPPSKPSSNPTSKPSSNPTSKPSSKPSSNPTSNPSSNPSSKPSSKPSQPITNTIHTTTKPPSQDSNYKSEIDDLKKQTKKLKLIAIIFVAVLAVVLLTVSPILIYFIVKTIKNGNKRVTESLHEPMI